MRLLIDYSAACNQGAGIGRYARGVVPAALAEMAGAPGLEAAIFVAADRRGAGAFEDVALGAFPPAIDYSVHRALLSRKRLDQIWHRIGLGVGATRLCGRADLTYSPDFFAPPLPRSVTISTVHDLAYLICPERTPRALSRFLAPAVDRQLRKAATVAVVSETTKRDLVERLAVAPERIAVIPNGVEERFLVASPPSDEQRRRLGLPDEYLLMVGTLEPRKNHQGAFAAMRLLGGSIGLPLLVAGRPGWQVAPIRRAADDLTRQGSVRWLDFVPDADLPALYAGAACLVYPSWYEGFGLPVLEALAVGIPVVTSTAPALLELAGEVAETADPAAPEALADAIERALAHGSRSAAARVRRQAVARGYTWTAAGRRLGRLWRDHLR